MKTKLASTLFLGFLLTAGSHTAAQASSASAQGQVSVEIYDYTHAKAALLLQAERTAAAILLKAGVETAWLACSTVGSAPTCAASDPTHLRLRILPDSMAKRFRSVEGDALGFAALGEQLNCDAWVFYDRVTDFAAAQGISPERLLAGVIAHELGHLLLGQNAHSSAGLMHSYWSHTELRAIECARLVFSDTESVRIQRGVAARRQVGSAVLAALTPSVEPARGN